MEMNARGQGHFKAVYPWTSGMVIYIKIVSNISATSLVQESGEGLQDQWSSGLLFLSLTYRLWVLIITTFRGGLNSTKIRKKFRSLNCKENIHKKEI